MRPGHPLIARAEAILRHLEEVEAEILHAQEDHDALLARESDRSATPRG